MLGVSPQLFHQLEILQSYPLLLRRYWADWWRWQLGEQTQCFAYCHWGVLTSFHFLCFLILVSPRHWSHGILDDLILRNSAAFYRQFSVPRSIWFLIVSSVPVLFRSRPSERPMTARESTSILFNCLWIIFAWFIISFWIPHNVVKHWREDDPACDVLWFTL